MNTRIDPQKATVADVVTTIYGDAELNLAGLSYGSSPERVEAYCNEAVRLATPFNAIQLGVLQAALLHDEWRVFSRRALKSWVRGIMRGINDYQKSARAEARRAKKAQRS